MEHPKIIAVTLRDFHNLLQMVELDFVSQAKLTPEELLKIHGAIDRFCKDMDSMGLSYLKGVVAGLVCLDSMIETIIMMSPNESETKTCPTDLN